MPRFLPLLLGIIGLSTGCGQAAGEGPERAAVIFSDNCAPCHGVNAEGKQDLEAPGIAGLPDWYIERQLNKFRKGIRGAHADDLPGLRMRPMSRTIPESDYPLLATYVSGLTPPPPEAVASMKGDVEAGKAHYGTCTACHGAEGAGNEALNAPPIGQLQSWYVENQLLKFRHDIRGAHPDDVHGAQMAPMAKALPSDDVVTDLSAYVSSL